MEEQTQDFQKIFFGGFFFAFVEYFCNSNPKTRTKIFELFFTFNLLGYNLPQLARYFTPSLMSSYFEG